MSKGDTTIGMQFEVGGASAAKMTVQDVYNSGASAAKKASNAEEAEARRRANAAKQLDKQRQKYKQANAIAEYQAEAAANKSKLDSAVALEKQRRAAKLQNLLEEERDRKRIEREALADRKRIEREKVREAKMAARERMRIAKDELRDQARVSRQQGAIGKLIGRGLWGAAMGVAGYAGVAGVTSLASSQSAAATSSADKRSEMERAITPVVALGNNVNKMGQIRAEVVGLSASLGRSNEEVGSFLEAVDSISNTMAADRLADIKRETIELTQLAGGDLRENFNMLAKTQIIFGEAFQNANQIQNKMYKVQSDTVSSMSEFSQRMPDLMSAGKALGLTVDEIAAAAVSATTVGGTAEKAFTGARTSLVAMEKAQEKGIQLTGTFVDKLKQLSDASKAGKIDLLEIFQGEGITTGFGLVDQIDRVRENVEKFKNMAGDTDVVGENLRAKYQDPRFATANIRELDKSLIENAPNIAADLGINNPFTKFMERFRAGKIAGSVGSDGMFGMGTIGGLAAAFGIDSIADEGNRVRLRYTSETSPFRKKLINERLKYQFGQFEEDKKRDIKRLGFEHEGEANLGTYLGYDWESPEMKAIKARSFDFNSAMENQPSLEKTIAIAAGIDELNKNQRETNRLLSLAVGGKSASMPSPGGSKANSQETL